MTVYQAKEALQQGLKANKEIVFIPSTAFVARLYTVDFLWQSPDQPTGISLFFCTESSTQEADIGLALLDKLDKADIQKASKQTLEVPVKNRSDPLDCVIITRTLPHSNSRVPMPHTKCDGPVKS